MTERGKSPGQLLYEKVCIDPAGWDKLRITVQMEYEQWAAEGGLNAAATPLGRECRPPGKPS